MILTLSDTDHSIVKLKSGHFRCRKCQGFYSTQLAAIAFSQRCRGEEAIFDGRFAKIHDSHWLCVTRGLALRARCGAFSSWRVAALGQPRIPPNGARKTIPYGHATG